MKIEKLKKKYSFTEENLKKIQNAVATAEKTTDGEIALAITPSCSNYGFWELIFATSKALWQTSVEKYFICFEFLK